MSWLTEVPKTMEYIIENLNETLLFVRVSETISNMKNGTRKTTKLVSEEAHALTLREINREIGDSNYILVKINKEEKNDGE